MSDPALQEELNRLLSRMTEASLAGAECRRLAELIEADSEARRQYLDYCQMHAILFSEHGTLASAVESNSLDRTGIGTRIEGLDRKRFKRRRRVLGLVLAAVVLIAAVPFSGLIPMHSAIPHRGEQVAVLSHSAGATFKYGAAGEAVTTTGSAIPEGDYLLVGGIAELTYETGVKVTIEAPASFVLISQARIELIEGKLSAHVPEDGVGFTVDTPHAAVVDLGTDFGVEVVDQNAEVHVFKGEVRIDLRAPVGPIAAPLRLAKGKATRINRITGLPAGINLDQQRFLRGFQTDSRQPFVQRIQELHPSVYYPMEPTEDGTKVADASGNRAHAIACLGKALRPIWKPGRFGAALDLGGPEQQTYAVAKWYPRSETNQLSVVGWVYARSRPRWASIAKNWAGANNRGQFHFGLFNDDGDLEVHIEDDSGDEVFARENIPLPLDQWHFVAFVADGSSLRLFRNGRQVAVKPYRGLHSNPLVRALGIGTKLNLRGDVPEEHDFNMWDGRLDELAIFNRALPSAEIQNLFALSQQPD